MRKWATKEKWNVGVAIVLEARRSRVKAKHGGAIVLEARRSRVKAALFGIRNICIGVFFCFVFFETGFALLVRAVLNHSFFFLPMEATEARLFKKQIFRVWSSSLAMQSLIPTTRGFWFHVLFCCLLFVVCCFCRRPISRLLHRDGNNGTCWGSPSLHEDSFLINYLCTDSENCSVSMTTILLVSCVIVRISLVSGDGADSVAFENKRWGNEGRSDTWMSFVFSLLSPFFSFFFFSSFFLFFLLFFRFFRLILFSR